MRMDQEIRDIASGNKTVQLCLQQPLGCQEETRGLDVVEVRQLLQLLLPRVHILGGEAAVGVVVEAAEVSIQYRSIMLVAYLQLGSEKFYKPGQPVVDSGAPKEE